MYRYGWPATHKPSVKSLHACTPRLWIPTSFIPRPALPFHPLLEDPLRPVIPLVCHTLLHSFPSSFVLYHTTQRNSFMYTDHDKSDTETHGFVYITTHVHILRSSDETHTQTHTHTLSIDIIRGNHLAGRGLVTDKRPAAWSAVFKKRRKIVSVARLSYRTRVYLICDNAAAATVYRIVFSSLTTSKTR